MRCLDESLDSAARLDVPFVYFVGAPIYGPFRSWVDEDTPIHPRTEYGLHQARAEGRIRAHRARHLIVRLPNVVGPGANEHQLIPSLLRQARSGSIHVQEGATRDLIQAEDVAEAVTALLRAGVANRTVVVASGISTSARDLSVWLLAETRLAARIVASEGGEAQRFRIDLLRSLAPGAPVFAVDYPRRVVADYVLREPDFLPGELP